MSQLPSLGAHRSTLPTDSEEQHTSIANERTISLVPVDPFDSVQSVEAAMAESQASAAATLVALLVACDGDDEAFDRSTIPFKNSSERRTFVLELEVRTSGATSTSYASWLNGIPRWIKSTQHFHPSSRENNKCGDFTGQ